MPRPSPPSSGNIASLFHHRLKNFKRPKRLLPFLVFAVAKALCSLVMLNLYMGSQIPIDHLENSFANMVRANFVRGPNKNLHTKVESNSTINETNNNNATLNKATSNQTGMIVPNLSDGTLQGKERLWNILQTRNVTQVDAKYWASIPTWDTILQNIRRKRNGNADNDESPIIYGLETCQAFQNITSSAPSQRRIAPAGLFNTGTNYLSVLLEYNCQNPHRVKKFHGNARRAHGNEWDVPWGKHSPASSRGNYFKNKNLKYTVDEVLPVVLVRNPFGWMKSMCRNPYTASWKGQRDKKTCPQLKEKNGKEYNPVDVKYGSGTTHHKSLGHLWNDWYGEYVYNNNATNYDEKKKAPFPRLIVRFEDIIFFPYEVTKQICKCAGGVIAHRQDDKDVANNTFHYVVRSAKAGFGHGPASQRNGLIDSWLRYGSGDPRDDYSEDDVHIASDVLDPIIMKTFGYSS